MHCDLACISSGDDLGEMMSDEKTTHLQIYERLEAVVKRSEKLGFFKALYFAIVVSSIFWLLMGFAAFAIWGGK